MPFMPFSRDERHFVYVFVAQVEMPVDASTYWVFFVTQTVAVGQKKESSLKVLWKLAFGCSSVTQTHRSIQTDLDKIDVEKTVCD